MRINNYWFKIGLGRTVKELDIGNEKPFEKTLFSMCTPDVDSYMKQKNKGIDFICQSFNNL